MKEPTTPFSIDRQEKAVINRKFLLDRGWILEEEKPLYESFVHSETDLLGCSINLYGGFSIWELHWMNKTPEAQFSTGNPNLTEEDYYKIVELLSFKRLEKK